MLKNSWPAFYDKIDSDPAKASSEFCKEALGFMNQSKPQFLRLFHPQEQEDVKQEICLHFIDDDLRVLRQYRSTGTDFGAWFYVSAYNKVRDILRKRKREIVLADISVDNEQNPQAGKPAASGNQQANLEHREKVMLVNRLIKRMDRYCQLLIRMSGDELKPSEMARVFRWPKEKAKKISDDLGYCREKLQKLLGQKELGSIEVS